MQSLPIRSILIASDLLEQSDPVIGSATALATRTGAQLHVVHALEFAGVPYSAMGAAAEYERQATDAREALRTRMIQALPEGEKPASEKVRVEGAPKAILERAREVSADLIILGPARPRAFRGPILGNTADHVIRSAHVPVLVLRDATELELRRVVVPIDLADPARGALDQALIWARAFGAQSALSGASRAEVRVLYVIPRRYEGVGVQFDTTIAVPQLQLEIEDAQQRVGGGGIDVREETVWGDVASDEVVKYVESERTDLLVLGTHGYGALGRALIGSVTSRIVRAATCPMLLVPPWMWAVDQPTVR